MGVKGRMRRVIWNRMETGVEEGWRAEVKGVIGRIGGGWEGDKVEAMDRKRRWRKWKN